MNINISNRNPADVMKLERMGANHQNRLSFMRILLRYLKLENWQFKRRSWEINERGIGYAVYEAKGPRRTYSLVCFAHDLPDEQRSDRVIANAWDATFTLVDGVPSKEHILLLYGNVPYQEAGRITSTELSLSRANRSSRLWSHVVDALSQGKQPDIAEIEKVGYLMRTTAVYGSGKFGAADRIAMEDRTAFSIPFLIEMLNVYLTRSFTLDLVEHMAKEKGQDQAVSIDPNIRRKFGIGNSTGLGMAPFLINHPTLLHAWVAGNEEAYLRVRKLSTASTQEKESFMHYLKRAQLNTQQWHTKHDIQKAKVIRLAEDLRNLEAHIQDNGFALNYPWEHLYQWVKDHLSAEGQEQFLSLMIEPYGAIVNDISKILSVNESTFFAIDGSMNIVEMINIIEQNYHWALQIDFTQTENKKYVWYTSIEKQEPRLGERYGENNFKDYEQPLCIAYDIYKLHQILRQKPKDMLLAAFLEEHPEFRYVIRRAQIVNKRPYAEICDNLIGNDIYPIHLLRFKLAHFGATKFDPRSNLWVRICMYQNAPFPEELSNFPCDDWVYPQLDEGAIS